MAAVANNTKTKKVLEKNKDERFHNILVTGKTGVGKSRLVNALVGRNVAEEGVSTLTAYEAAIKDVAVTVWDSPGLQDGTTNEDKYIQDMKDNIKDIALMIYCVRMDEARFHEADKKAIKTLTDEFGKEVWNRAVVALTFANKVEDPDGNNDLEYFEFRLKEWKKQIEGYFTSIGIHPEVCVPVIPAGSLKKTNLPDRENWLAEMRNECYKVMKASTGRATYRKMSAVAINNTKTKNVLEKKEDERFHNILVTGKTGVGKSLLVNALVDRNVAEDRARKLTAYETAIEDVAVTVWDSPGLQDGTSNEDQYIQDIKDSINDIALMIYCVRMDDARFYDADKKAIRTLTDEFGKEVWNHAVVALTFANKVEDPDGENDLEYFEFRLKEWKKQIKGYFTSVGINPQVCVPVIPAGRLQKTSLPDRDNWLADMRNEIYEILKAPNQPTPPVPPRPPWWRHCTIL